MESRSKQIDSNTTQSSESTPREINGSFSSQLIYLRQQTQILTSNLQLTANEQTNIQKEGCFSTHVPILEESSIAQSNKLGKIMQQMSLQETVNHFEHFDVCNTLSVCFTSVLNAILDAKPIQNLMQAVKKIPKDQNQNGAIKIAKQLILTLKTGLEYINQIGALFARIFYDSYHYEPIFEQFFKTKTFLRSVMLLLGSTSTLSELAENLRAPINIQKVFAKVLLKILSFQTTNNLKQQFVDFKGIFALKQWLSTTNSQSQEEEYATYLKLVIQITKLGMSAIEDLCDAGFDKLLIRHLLQCQSKQMYAHFFVILKTICRREDLTVNITNFLITKVSDAFGNASRLNLFITGTELLIKIGNADAVVALKVEEMKQEIIACDENKKVLLQNKLNRFQEWISQFKDFTTIYAEYSSSTATLQQNAFDDDLIDKAIKDLQKIWQRSKMARSLVLTDSTCIFALLNCAKSQESTSVVINALKALNLVMKDSDDNLISLCVRNRIVPVIRTCIQKQSSELRHLAVSLGNKMLQTENGKIFKEMQDDFRMNQVLHYCFKMGLCENEVDDDIQQECIELMRLLIEKNEINCSYIIDLQGEVKSMEALLVRIKLIQNPKSTVKRSELVAQSKVIEKLCLVLIKLTRSQSILKKANQPVDPKSITILIEYLKNSCDSINEKPQTQQAVLAAILNLVSQIIDENLTAQNTTIKLHSVRDVIIGFLKQRKSFKLCGCACNLIQSLLWKNQQVQNAILSNELIFKEVVQLCDFNQLVNVSDPEINVESMQEVSFFALLAVINLTKDSAKGQQMARENHAIQILLRQLKSGTYQPKKTACVCLSTIVQGNGPNQKFAIEKNAVPTLTELINDEDDDELSAKSFECLQALGPKVIPVLVNFLLLAYKKIGNKFCKNRTAIIDIYKMKERHIYMRTDSAPNLRHIGPQECEELIESNVLASMQKIFPVLNGLIQTNNQNIPNLTEFMQVFELNLPLEIYKDALHVTLNVLLNQVHSIDQVNVQALSSFMVDIAHIDYSVLQQNNNQDVFFIDCFAQLNPNYNEQIANEERTIEEMQPVVFCQKLYKLRPDNRMVDENGKVVTDKTLIFKKDATQIHIQQLRGLSYACFAQILKSESKQNVFEYLQTTLKHIPQLVLRDVMLLPRILEKSSESDQGQEELNNEALEILTTLMSLSPQIADIFSKQGANLLFLRQLREYVDDWELGFDNQSIVRELDGLLKQT